jgi:peptidyl-tRNA hydrolase, PTH1 family
VFVVVGLGNPGAEYAGTRHNAGFEVVDRLAARAGTETRRDRTLNAEAARARIGGADVLLVKPLSWMNLSGAVARRAAERAGLLEGGVVRGVPGLMVVSDDYHVGLGSLRMRASGSAGGHNGLADVEAALGTRDYPRLRVGIGPCSMADPKDFVLGRFRPSERALAAESFDRAADAVESWLAVGMERTMERYNGARGAGPDEAPGRTEG